MTNPHFRWFILFLTFLVGVTCMGWNWLTFPMFIPDIAKNLSIGTAQAQFLFGVISLSLIVTGIVGGTLGSTYSPRWTVGGGALLVGLSGILRSLLSGYYGMITASLCTGAGLGLIIPNAVQTLGIWFPPNELGFANGVRMTGERAGTAVAQGVLVGFLINYYGGWRPAVATLGVSALVIAGFWLCLYRNPNMSNKGPNPSVSNLSAKRLLNDFFESMRALFSDQFMLVLGMIAFMHTYSTFSYMGLLPTWLLNFHFVAEDSVGLYNSLLFWMLLVGGLVLPSLSDLVPDRKLILIPLAGVIGLGMMATGYADSPLRLTIAIIVSGCAAGGLIPLVFTIINDRMDVDSSSQSTEAGFLLSISMPGVVVGPSIAGYLFDNYGVTVSAMAVGSPIFFVGVYLAVQYGLQRTYDTS